MHTLILDQYAHQSLFKRLLGNMLTSFAWAFWLYLWLPLFAAITQLVGSPQVVATSAASSLIMELIVTLGSHAEMVFAMIAVFVAWSLLQWIGKHHRHHALQKQKIKPSIPVLPAVYKQQDEKNWRQAKSMVVSHDNASGHIYKVEIT
ncbi:MAG: poly-beta-1,6-N-acetyl-D-glucosamine biosynthesis protein PgaD [Methyloglobulus sp.]|nr:poly-beta-1,6-N-acetyl-D-glucosamine biosynthesis protein PgaD [Methyloglobulus sp.]